MNDDIKKLRETFLIEALEILESLEESLVKLDKDLENNDILNDVFRSIHTLKGSSGIVEDFHRIGSLAHFQEDLLDAIRDGKIKLSRDIVDALFQSIDVFKLMLKQVEEGEIKETPEELLMIEKFKSFLEASSPSLSEDSAKIESPLYPTLTEMELEAEHQSNLYQIKISLDKDCLKSGIDPLQPLKNLSSIGKIVEVKSENNIPTMDKLEPDELYISPIIIKYETDANVKEIEDIFEFVMVHGEVSIQQLKVGSEQLAVDSRQSSVVGNQLSVDNQQSSINDIKSSIEKSRISVKVNPQKLDALMELVGEMAISQSLVSRNPYIINCPDRMVLEAIAKISKITRDLQDLTMSIRMVPLAQTFYKMKRIVRDIARKSGKEVNLNISGEDTELDKNVIEQIDDPLLHIIRNAVDHGIETPEERKKKNKPIVGNIWLSASNQRGHIIIQVKDDGKGISKDVIYKKALEKGILKEGESINNDEQLFNILATPGFSTASEITNISGRGVGLDVVKNMVKNLRGQISLLSEEGIGTSVSISLPLTLAIIDGMIVRIGNQRYIIQMDFLERALRPDKKNVYTITGKGEVVKVMDKLIPLVRLYELFNLKPDTTNPWEALVIVVDDRGRKACFMVDDLLEQQQVVIKGLGDKLKNIKGFQGSAILGDGRVGLIIDVPSLIDMALADGVMEEEGHS